VRLVERRFSGFSIVRLSSAVDLEHSFGSLYSGATLTFAPCGCTRAGELKQASWPCKD
jgi:hypothetical protein